MGGGAGLNLSLFFNLPPNSDNGICESKSFVMELFAILNLTTAIVQFKAFSASILVTRERIRCCASVSRQVVVRIIEDHLWQTREIEYIPHHLESLILPGDLKIPSTSSPCFLTGRLYAIDD